MILRSSKLVTLVAIGALAACSGQSSTTSLPTIAAQSASRSIAGGDSLPPPGHFRHADCGFAGPGDAHCHALLRDDLPENHAVPDGANGTALASSIAGYHPADLQAAYALPSGTFGQATTPIIAIVDAYNDPNAEADLNTYRSAFGLGACTTANGCFKKLNQNGAASPLPTNNASWGQEISLDLDMASAICPACRIYLFEGSSAQNLALATAVQSAAAAGAAVISNSYGSAESTSFDSYYNNATSNGITVTASSGDSGYGTQSPASAIDVVAVGGTSLNRATNLRGWSETAWSGAGSGCSASNKQQSWQTTYGITACSSFRAEADVSAVADPNTGVAVYDSYGRKNSTGWLVFGGTSVASPVIASVYALAVLNGKSPQSNAAGLYAVAKTTTGLNDVTSGSNGTCPVAIVCNAGSGWDGPTGLGTPNGFSIF